MLDRIIQQFGLQVQSINGVEDSHSSTIYKCTLSTSENVFLKFPFSKLKYQREFEAYEILKGRVSVPEMLDYWSGDEECHGALLLSELKGKTLTPAATPKIAYQVGVLQAEMHSISPPAVLTTITNEFPNWSDFVKDQFYSFAEDVKAILDEKLYEKAINKFENMRQHLPSPDGPSFVHMDFRPANIIVDHDQVSGIIDFESVRFGSTDIDFTKLYRDFLSCDVNLYHAYQEGYKSIRPLIDLENVLPFCQFTDAFNSIGWCKRRGIEKNALFLEENLVRLKNWLL
ncbi:aminoglycoside phosphotransferase family protein [Fictibacillus barbaricus]|uniref:Aminoglycoside phosphotransferase (APT) family kinase protein n=1 Tax=Fictibacillus barbaricus TaxID=182136 RepID=A0ABU1TWQ6_9BACL|nr:aminoglycoside phosphotransferase family protein [Fictibacillus barbaricus]MDR7071641.1 aminoglycoside phosphotransferase (APT) family kinase protein [Fictibacillus barbaricus]